MPSRSHRPRLPLLLLALLAPWQITQAQQSANPGTEPQVQQAGNLQFIGSDARLGIGMQNRGGLTAEFSGVLNETPDYAWLTDLWLNNQSGGVQLSYHFLRGDAVIKSFLAYDQNQQHDKKYTIGIGRETDDWFGNLYASYGASSRRLLSSVSNTDVNQVSGVDGSRNYIDTITTVTQTSLYERAYDYGIGARIGHYYADQQLRLTAGMDYEWGHANAKQIGANLTAEKFFVGTPHSIALQVAHYRKSGDFEDRLNDNRIGLFYRYNLGSTPSSRYQEKYRMVEDKGTRTVTTTVPAHTEHHLVKTTASMNGDAFFLIGSAQLSDTARAELDKIAGLLKEHPHIGQVHITGHTCDLGPAAFNLKLSQQRAEAVRDYLMQAGALKADEALVEGKGKSEPKYPPKPETREKNRRVDLEFISEIEKDEVTEVPAQTVSKEEAVVTYHREDIQQEPAWVRASLRSTVEHKRSVDTYRSQEKTQTSSTKRTYLNRPPQAGGVSASTKQNQPVTIDVLASASDPDGNTLTISSVSSPAHGTAVIQGQKVVYTPATDYVGNDQFSYTVSDGQGGTASGQVSVGIAANPVTPPVKPNHDPIARDDFFSVPTTQPSTLDVLANDSDPDGDPLTIISVTPVAHGAGTVSIVNNKVVFTPAHGFFTDSFRYTVSDGHGGTATATVWLVDP